MGKCWWEQDEPNLYEWDFCDEKGRERIHQWSKARRERPRGINKICRGFLVSTFSFNTLKSFLQNINFTVVIQMVLAGLSIYAFQYFNISFDVDISLLVSPIVFPLAFSINADFQRREKVLLDLANFKSSGMFWLYCMREWKATSSLDENWMNAVHSKLKSLLFHLREYLLTERVDRRNVILDAMYEDMSDCSQLIETLRSSSIPSSRSLCSVLINFLQMMSLSFERLRVVREYRSPRSIRSFNKVLILFLPLILGPCFVYKASRSISSSQPWSVYYISILISFVFSALQGVQDTLDDPFDGMSEDDINLEQIDEWTFQSLQPTVNRIFHIGRFKVSVDCGETIIKPRATTILQSAKAVEKASSFIRQQSRTSVKRKVSRYMERSCSIKGSDYLRQSSKTFTFDAQLHPFANVLEKMKGDTKIGKFGRVHSVLYSSSTSSLDSVEVRTRSFSYNTVSISNLVENNRDQ